MHKAEDSSRIATILGLVFEGIGMFTIIAFAAGINVVEMFDVEFFIEEGFSQNEAEIFVSILDVLGVVLFVLGAILLIVFMINLVVFTKLLSGRFNESKAAKTYLYQIVWGALNLMFNQIAGIAYLISGIKGRSTTVSRSESIDQ